jgi:hypothetical protein
MERDGYAWMKAPKLEERRPSLKVVMLTRRIAAGRPREWQNPYNMLINHSISQYCVKSFTNYAGLLHPGVRGATLKGASQKPPAQFLEALRAGG